MNLTLAKAREIAQGMEAAERNAKRLRGETEVPVNKVIPRIEKTNDLVWRNEEKPCYYFGRSGHVVSSR